MIPHRPDAFDVGFDDISVFQEFLRWKKTSSTAAVVVLSRQQSDWKTVLEEAGSTRVLVHPVQLRDIRVDLETALGQPTSR